MKKFLQDCRSLAIVLFVAIGAVCLMFTAAGSFTGFSPFPGGAGGSATVGGNVTVDDTAYDATSWNDETLVAPSKNAARDKIESMTAASVLKALFDANTILSADSDNTPAALAVAEQRVIGRVTSGSIAALILGIAPTNVFQVPADPGADALWGWDDTNGTMRQFLIGDGLTYTAATNTLTASGTGAVLATTYDAYSILMATTDDTPVALTVTEQTVVGRKTGGAIAALAIDADLSTASEADDTLPSAKATVTALALKAAATHNHNATSVFDTGVVPAANLPENSATAAGTVASGAAQNAKVWKTDADGIPGWRDDATGGTPTFDTVGTGTNTSATLTVGAGGTLTYSTSGIVNASQFMGVTSVDATEFGYVNGVTSALQTQLNAKAPLANPTFTADATFSANSANLTHSGTTTLAIASTSGTVSVEGVTFTGDAVTGAASIAALTYAFGADPADAGAIRLSSAGNIAWEASAAGTDVVGMSVDSSEIVQIAPSGASGVTITPATTVTAALTASTSVATPFIALGTDPADAGAVRLPNAGYILSEADIAGVDVSVIGVDSAEVIQIGASGASGVTITPALTLTGHPTIEGVTATGATGTGKMVFDTAPVFVTSIEAPFLVIGSAATAADAGGIRLPNASYVMAEADLAGTDISVIGVDSSEVIQIGASGASGVTITPALTVTGHVTLEGVTSTTATGTQALVFGTAPVFTTSIETPIIILGSAATAADAGTIRMPNAGSIQFEADAAGTDINALSVDSAEVVQIAASGASGVTITPDTTITGALTVNGNTTVGNADTDTLTIRDLIVGGNSRAVWIAGSAPTPTYATATNELYVAGDIETAGTIYAAGANFGTGTDGTRGSTYVSNTSFTCAGDQLYFLNDVLYTCEGGTGRPVVTANKSNTWTGTTHSFAGVTNLLLPTAAPDAAGEIGGWTAAAWAASHGTYKLYDGTAETYLVAVQAADTPSNAEVLTWNTGGTITWESAPAGLLSGIGDPTGDTEIVFGINEEVVWSYTGDFTTGSQFQIIQQTGNPSGGVLFEVFVTDPQVTAARIGDGTNYAQFGPNGAVTFAGTSTFSAAGATSSVPWLVGSGTASNTAEGTAYWESDTDLLTIGDGATGIGLNFTANSIYTFPAATATLQSTTGTPAGFIIASQAQGDVLYASSATAWARLGAATAGNPLISGGAAANPSYLGIVLAGGTNTFSVTNGTASLDVAAGAALNIDTGLQVATGAVVINGNAGGSSQITVPNSTVVLPATPIGGTYGATANTIGKRGADATTVAASGITEDGTNVSFGALNLVSTGTISGGMPLLGTWASPITSVGAYALAAANAYGRWIYYNDTDEITLPAAVAGMSVCIQVPAATLVPVGPNGTDVIVLEGTALSAGQAFSIAAVAGNFACVVADAANHWVTGGTKGTLTAIP